MRLGARTLVAAGAITLAIGNLGRIPGGLLGGRTAPVVLNDLLLQRQKLRTGHYSGPDHVSVD